MLIATISGIAGGMWAIVSGGWVLSMVFFAHRYAVETNWFLITVMVFISLMGILSEAAIALRSRNPRLAFKLIMGSIIGLFFTNFIDPGVLPLLALPAMILMIPVAVGIRRLGKVKELCPRVL